MSDLTPEEQLAALDAARTARRKELAAQRLVQLVIDRTAIDALREEFGDTNIAEMEVPFSPGLPVLIACKTPEQKYFKKYQARVKGNKDHSGDAVAAQEELAATSRVYPPRDDDGNALYKRLLDERPGIHVLLGGEAIKLLSAHEEERAKT